jgi:AcrR family transcriptional regulator
MGATIEVVATEGFTAATVSSVVARAQVSRRTFYDCYTGLQACFLAALDLGLARTEKILVEAFGRERRWQDGVRGALASLLVFLDSESFFAKVWLIDSLAEGPRAREHRERHAARLTSLIVDYWVRLGSPPPDEEAVARAVASVLGVLRTHLLTERTPPLIELLGPLMGLIASPFLDADDQARAIALGEQLAASIQRRGDSWLPVPAARPVRSALVACAHVPAVSRLSQCLIFLAEHPGASNRQVAEGIDVVHQSQISSLLCRLAEQELATKRSLGAGRRNEWWLTRRGERTARGLFDDSQRCPAALARYVDAGGAQ